MAQDSTGPQSASPLFQSFLKPLLRHPEPAFSTDPTMASDGKLSKDRSPILMFLLWPLASRKGRIETAYMDMVSIFYVFTVIIRNPRPDRFTDRLYNVDWRRKANCNEMAQLSAANSDGESLKINKE